MATLMGTRKGPPFTFLACLVSDVFSQMFVAVASPVGNALKLGLRRSQGGKATCPQIRLFEALPTK